MQTKSSESETKNDGRGSENPEDPYRITSLLSDGSRVSLYRAVRTSDLQPVVIKRLNSGYTSALDLERLRQEYKIARKFDGIHCIIQAHELILSESAPAIVVEDFGGTSLENLIKSPLPIERFLNLACSVTEALSVIHERDVVHLDVKPDNIIVVSHSGETKITDFGLSRILKPGAVTYAPEGVIEGTLPYMSPEQTGRMNRSIDFRSDYYSLGATFYRMITGEMLCSAKDAMEWIHCHIAKPPPKIQTIAPHVPPILCALIEKLLSKHAEDRYQTARGILHDLEQCLKEWQQYGKIEPFSLGERDRSARFQVPSHLFGREKELPILLDAFEKLRKFGGPAALLISGYSGIGKSSLVHELYKPLIRANGRFISGKFDQNRRHIPYATLVQGFKSLVQQILTESNESLSKWREQIREQLGLNANVIVEVIPELELVIGKQPAVTKLGPAESLNRFNLVFQRFIQIFADPNRPLVVFLDDMQWADSATLTVLDTLLNSAELKHVLFILAYRDNEVTETHPFSLLLETLKKPTIQRHEIKLFPLKPEVLNLLVSETLHQPPGKTVSLTELIYQKTAGNPFFSVELLKTLHREQLIRYHAPTSAWEWDTTSILTRDFSDNVLDLMVSAMDRFSSPTQEVLKICSCIGNSFGIQLLSELLNREVESVMNDLGPAIEEGWILPTVATTQKGERRFFRFQHDRIQQAAYSRLELNERLDLHYSIGLHLLREMRNQKTDDQLFETVNHLTLSRARLKTDTEVRQLSELNFAAGIKAKSTTAYLMAERYFQECVSLQGQNTWDVEYRLNFDAHLQLAECQYLGGKLEQAEDSFILLEKHAKDELDSGKVYALQIRLYQIAGEYQRALEIALRSFERFGLTVPETDESAGIAVNAELEKAKSSLAGRRIADLLDAPLMTDERIRILCGLLEASGPPVYMVRPSLFPWVTLKLLNFSLTHGNTESSCYGYAIYGILLAAALDDVHSAYEMAQLSIQLNEKFDDLKLKGCMLHMLGDHINFWKHPISTDLPILERGFKACVEGGDLIYSNYIAFQSIWHGWEAGERLSQLIESTEAKRDFALQSKHRANALTIQLEQQFIRAWEGKLPDPTLLSDLKFDEKLALSEITEANYGSGIVYYHIMSLILCYSFGAYERALLHAETAKPLLAAVFSMPIEPTFWFYFALTKAAVFKMNSKAEKTETENLLHDVETRFQKWTRNCPENFQPRHELLLGEIARIEDRHLDALRHYQNGLKIARKEGLWHTEALGCELANQICIQNDLEDAGTTYLSQGRDAYLRWGALSKVRRMKLPSPAFMPHHTKKDRV